VWKFPLECIIGLFCLQFAIASKIPRLYLCVEIAGAGGSMGYVVNEAAFRAGGGAQESAHHVHSGAAARPPGGHLGIESLLHESMVLRKIEEGLDKEEPSLSVTTAPLIRPNLETLSHIAHLRAAQKRNSRLHFSRHTSPFSVATQRSR